MKNIIFVMKNRLRYGNGRVVNYKVAAKKDLNFNNFTKQKTIFKEKIKKLCTKFLAPS